MPFAEPQPKDLEVVVLGKLAEFRNSLPAEEQAVVDGIVKRVMVDGADEESGRSEEAEVSQNAPEVRREEIEAIESATTKLMGFRDSLPQEEGQSVDALMVRARAAKEAEGESEAEVKGHYGYWAVLWDKTIADPNAAWRFYYYNKCHDGYGTDWLRIDRLGYYTRYRCYTRLG